VESLPQFQPGGLRLRGDTFVPAAAYGRMESWSAGLVQNPDKIISIVRLVGSDANGSSNSNALKAGETERTFVGVEVDGNAGALAKAELKTHFTEAETGADKGLFDLQPGVNDSRRALEDFSLMSSLLADRLTLSSYRRDSTLALFDTPGGGAHGALEQSHIAAKLWRSSRFDADADASLSRASQNYWDFGDSLDPDLHMIGNRVWQYRSKLRFDRFGLAAAMRDTAALMSPGFRAERSEFDTRLSFDLSGFCDDLGIGAGYRAFSIMPDSVWAGANLAASNTVDASALALRTADKVSLGMGRNFGPGTINISYWESASRSAEPVPVFYRLDAHALEVASNLKFGALALTGNLSFLGGQTFDAGAASEQNTVNCSFAATWQAPAGFLLKAGVTTNSFQNEFFSYSGLEERHSFRYQLSFDLSQLASAFAYRDVQLKLSASMQGNRNRSLANVTDDVGNVFTGLQLAFPFHS
jgi:hypothetical protein